MPSEDPVQLFKKPTPIDSERCENGLLNLNVAVIVFEPAVLPTITWKFYPVEVVVVGILQLLRDGPDVILQPVISVKGV